eukprot:3389550-Ditylum_brightwellii.AAC.1
MGIHNFRLSELQMTEIWENMLKLNSPREAVCQWAVDNFDYLESFIPSSYPRVIREGADNTGLFISSMVLACLSISLVLVAGVVVVCKKDTRVVKYAQLEFLLLLLSGALLISIGAILLAVPATDGICGASIWFVNLGYTLELVPLIVKVAAINKLMVAAKKMRRVVVRRKPLFYGVADSISESGETIVTVTYFCTSKSD